MAQGINRRPDEKYSTERLEEIRKIGIKMSERLRLQEEFSNQKPGLLKFAKTSRSNTTVLQKRGIKKARKFSSDRRAGKLRSFESGFCEDIPAGYDRGQEVS